MTHSPSPFSHKQIAELLAGLDDNFVLLETAKITDDNYTSLLFHKPIGRLQCSGGITPVQFLDTCQEMLARGFYLAG